MLRSVIYIVLSIILSAGFAFYQRITGPTYPVKGKIEFYGNSLLYRLPRSCSIGGNDCKAYIKQANVNFYIMYKRYGIDEKFIRLDALKNKDSVYILIPDNFPQAAKIEYDAFIEINGNVLKLNKDRVVLRFKSKVSKYVLIPHILIMFFSLIVMIYLILKIIFEGKYSVGVFWLNYILIFLGGFIFGPLLQKQAFGVWWSGFPLGYDVTDNKTFVSFLVWSLAALNVFLKRDAKKLIMISSFITIISYLIPHSLLGTEYDYNTNKLK